MFRFFYKSQAYATDDKRYPRQHISLLFNTLNPNNLLLQHKKTLTTVEKKPQIVWKRNEALIEKMSQRFLFTPVILLLFNLNVYTPIRCKIGQEF